MFDTQYAPLCRPSVIHLIAEVKGEQRFVTPRGIALCKRRFSLTAFSKPIATMNPEIFPTEKLEGRILNLDGNLFGSGFLIKKADGTWVVEMRESQPKISRKEIPLSSSQLETISPDRGGSCRLTWYWPVEILR
jgi:hypothetical protein